VETTARGLRPSPRTLSRPHPVAGVTLAPSASAVRQTHPDLAPLVAARRQLYNRDADELAWLSSRPPGRAPGVAPGHRPVDHLSTDLQGIAASLRLGATAMASLVLREPARLSAACPPLDAVA
jgi:hypothetical protein